ncbi:MAG: CRISPR-associated endonuclease Cas3'', partial [Thermoanaerobaculia bacterium]|nr:CRISPR-associated endonuclease Cas3'' [Thermoanaerobaculia bacterium]
MEAPSRIAFTLWAKRSREREEEFHPLCHHLLDVAQVTSLIWSERVSGSVRSRFAEELGLRVPEAGAWIAYWSGLHDLGKASPAFQGKVARGRAQAESVGLEFPHPAGSAPHGTLTARELPPLLSQSDGCPAPLPSDLAQRLATAVGGHHGVFPRAEELLFADPRSAGGHRWSGVRREIVHLLAGALGLRNLTAPSRDPGNAFLFFLAGLTSVADWIGSNEGFFPFAADHD